MAPAIILRRFTRREPGRGKLKESDFKALKENIRLWAGELGFQAVGVTDLDLSDHAPRVRSWLEQGFQGEMAYLTRNLSKRLDLSLIHISEPTRRH